MSEVHNGLPLRVEVEGANFMPLDSEDFASIANLVELEVGRLIGRRRDAFIVCAVKRRDQRKKLIWVKEFGDQPIPLVSFQHIIEYFDESPRGTVCSFMTYRKTGVTIGTFVPELDELVLIVRDMGYDGHPYCLGVIQSVDYIQDLEDD
jgi:hypothetical protein